MSALIPEDRKEIGSQVTMHMVGDQETIPVSIL